MWNEVEKPHKNITVAALAGRRIDDSGSEISQFPLAMVPSVKLAISNLLRDQEVGLLICSAACGADLLALDAALDAGIRCRVILPFEPSRFRQTSVIDRPGDWGAIFDRIIPVVASNKDLIVLSGDQSAERAYQRTNETIIREVSSTPNSRHIAIIVWEGRPRKKNDATAEFRRLANTAGMQERIVPTL